MNGLATLACVLAFATGAAALQLPAGIQFPPAAAPQEMTGAAAIDVVVVAAATGRPVAGATVRAIVLTDSGTFTRTASTDRHGRARLFGLAKGRVRISASHANFLSGIHGQSHADDATGTYLEIDESPLPKPVTLRLLRGATLAGTLLDDANEPLAGVQVRAYRRTAQDGRWQFSYAAADETDDRGAYRIIGLAAGDYVVGMIPLYMERGAAPGVQLDDRSAAPSATSAAEATLDIGDGRVLVLHSFSPVPVTIAASGRTMGYEATYFPGGPLQAASVVAVAPGDVREGLDLRLRATLVSRVSGRVVDPEPQALEAVNLVLNPVAPEARDVVQALHVSLIGPRGEFNFPFVPRGEYWLTGRVQRSSDEPHLWLRRRVAVGDRPTENLQIEFERGLTIAGSVRLAERSLGGAAGSVEGQRVSATTTAESPALVDPMTFSTRTDRDGSFRIENLPAGIYRLAVGPLPAGLGLTSIVASGPDVHDDVVHLEPGARVDNLLLGVGRLASVEGTLRDSAGQPTSDGNVIVFAKDERDWSADTRRIRSVRPTVTGRFIVSDLAPGDYLLAAVDAEPAAWRDPVFLTALRARALSVSLRDGDRLTRDLRLR